MDGLLLDTEPLWGESMLAVATKHKVNIRSDFFKYTTGLRINEVTAFWKTKFGWSSSISSDEMAHEIVSDIIERSIKYAKIMPGVLQTIHSCKAQGIKMGVATSSPKRMMMQLLQHFQLDNYFDECTSAEDCILGKPHPDVYIKCATAIGEDPWNCIAMEDSINGMVAAKAARMKVVAIPDSSMLEHPSFGLANLTIPSMENFSIEIYHEILLH